MTSTISIDLLIACNAAYTILLREKAHRPSIPRRHPANPFDFCFILQDEIEEFFDHNPYSSNVGEASLNFDINSVIHSNTLTLLGNSRYGKDADTEISSYPFVFPLVKAPPKRTPSIDDDEGVTMALSDEDLGSDEASDAGMDYTDEDIDEDDVIMVHSGGNYEFDEDCDAEDEENDNDEEGEQE